MIQPRRTTMHSQPAPFRLRRHLSIATLILRSALPVLELLFVPAILAETSVPAPTHIKSAEQESQPRRRAVPNAHAVSTQPHRPAKAIAAEPAALSAPIRLASQPPNRARVSWDSRGLEIEAYNSSLNQIL